MNNKWLRKEMLDIMKLSDEDIEVIYQGQLSSSVFDKLSTDRKLFGYLVDTELFSLLEQWLKERDRISKEEKKELLDSLELNYEI